MLENLRADFRRNMHSNSRRAGLRGVLAELTNPGTHAILVYRYQHWVLRHVRIPLVRQLLGLVGSVAQFYVRAFIGVNIPPAAEIGPGFVIHTWTGIFLPACRIGRNFTVLQGVTIDYACQGIGDEVLVGAGAKVIRKVTIGDRARIGANAVVLEDVPADCTVVGNPARILQRTTRDLLSSQRDPGDAA